ncbi:MAG: hypothetical protein M3R26_05125, partial [Actinomycetota bacterium]|nr:hypothetical protein [Actinomycetota bacterium]
MKTVVIGSSLAEWLTAAGTGGATVVALALGFKEWAFRPRLKARFSPANISDRVVTTTYGGGPAGVVQGVAGYVRLRISNDGRTSAGRTHVSLLGVENWADDMRWVGSR